MTYLEMLLLRQNVRPSKHRTKPMEGKVKINSRSSFRKLARALKRGVVPADRMFVIETAMLKAGAKA